MDAIELLEQQHREAEDLFGQVLAAGDPDAIALFEELAETIAVHSKIEEQIFYPRSMRDETRELLGRMVEKQLVVKRLTAAISRMEDVDERFREAVRRLQSAMLSHIHEERTQLFPQAQEALTPAELSKLGVEMAQLVTRLLQGEVGVEVSRERDASARL